MSLEELSNQETIEANNNSEVKAESNFTIDENVLENQEELERVLEAVIYVEGTVSISRLRNLFKCENTDIRNYIENINNRYKSVGSAIEILEIGDSVMMTIIPSTFGTLSAIYDRKRKKKISKAMLQTLSIIAYKQPLTKAEIDDIRQSDSSYHLRMLMEDGFIAWKGRKDYLDKRQTYGTTDKFLMHFGINSLDDLPKLRELKDLEFNRND
ncbi:SMC-Scp complex subunit ScpB [Brachyspira pilosicoli]|uniref:SMC-Scp complex subunit ScpB n=5 Tax=Brachyspira pilosicoli TaxID=52584 RepID=A0AAJ6GFP5_BRAPL|nr:SMC-Scp complex subunit ScpB [Brachyspira pilosicoli]ADK31405.1 putative segregation and condesation protein B [Brachyspira pilosicoli 95/1000]AFR71839.1 putative segregation and condesation protein B [Brachyspira pilosicoli B2904]AGA66795.1 putative segregation and condesation protein B [Brachyspira pilosicoli P43/6/78]MBW5378106.1 SMC-Scp complex subunit ScpB [Brachyspira pilosicoli]MBW5381917.1 SMC-Scp complex subunit ScpB [Brachyspira pilosicoli]